jgi:putative ABC transport system ATP-binding protein
MLKLVAVSKSYTIGPTELRVLADISLEVGKGELLSIIGPSGSGKSTLMNIIGLLDRPTSGAYFMGEKKITYEDDREISRIRNETIGFVFQQYQLLSRLSALENVGIPLLYRGMGRTEIRERSLEYLKKVGMDDRAGYHPNELSGGQQQRVAIARALVGNPGIILADEPTGALDSRTGQEIMDLFKQLNAEEGMTVVVVTHDPRIAAQCNRQVELRDGRISCPGGAPVPGGSEPSKSEVRPPGATREGAADGY